VTRAPRTGVRALSSPCNGALRPRSRRESVAANRGGRIGTELSCGRSPSRTRSSTESSRVAGRSRASSTISHAARARSSADLIDETVVRRVAESDLADYLTEAHTPAPARSRGGRRKLSVGRTPTPSAVAPERPALPPAFIQPLPCLIAKPRPRPAPALPRGVAQPTTAIVRSLSKRSVVSQRQRVLDHCAADEYVIRRR